MAAPPIVIAGAGVGGLTAALSLARAGRQVEVLERAATIEEIGAGLQISPNAGRVLASLGLEPALSVVALEPQAINIRRINDGRVLARLPLSDARERWGAPFRVFHRSDLQQTLLQGAQERDLISIRTASRVGDFEEGGPGVVLRVHGADGMSDIEASGLVGADGVRSSVRGRLVRNSKDAPRYSGYTAWRALIPVDAAPAALRIRETQLWLGPGFHVVHYPLRDASIISVVVIVQDAALPEKASRLCPLTALSSFNRCRRVRSTMTCAAFLRQAPPGAIGHSSRGRALSQWSKGAVTLLGDAAHPMLPFLAQGAAQAIEDADALGRAFMTLGVSVESAFDAYQRARMRRANRDPASFNDAGRLFAHARPSVGSARSRHQIIGRTRNNRAQRMDLSLIDLEGALDAAIGE